jgi:hypothetical protein
MAWGDVGMKGRTGQGDRLRRNDQGFIKNLTTGSITFGLMHYNEGIPIDIG